MTTRSYEIQVTLVELIFDEGAGLVEFQTFDSQAILRHFDTLEEAKDAYDTINNRYPYKERP